MLSLLEAQQLHEGLHDQLLRPALMAFFEYQRENQLTLLVQNVRRQERDTHRESFIAGRVDAAENTLREMDDFAARAIKEATE